MNVLKSNMNISSKTEDKKKKGPLHHPKFWKQGVLIVVSITKTVNAQFAEAKVSGFHTDEFNILIVDHKSIWSAPPLPFLDNHCKRKLSQLLQGQTNSPLSENTQLEIYLWNYYCRPPPQPFPYYGMGEKEQNATPGRRRTWCQGGPLPDRKRKWKAFLSQILVAWGVEIKYPWLTFPLWSRTWEKAQ